MTLASDDNQQIKGHKVILTDASPSDKEIIKNEIKELLENEFKNEIENLKKEIEV